MKFVFDNILLIAIALVSGGMLVWPALRGRAGGPTLGTLAATRLMNTRDVQIIDVRTAAEFGAGSLPQARNLPLTDLPKRAGELRKDQPALVVCETGRRASLAAVKLRSAGIGEVYILAGGVDAWRAAGLPLTK
jgi:rhodanese-related sulfurtransferase